jgi:hypothetical protein
MLSLPILFAITFDVIILLVDSREKIWQATFGCGMIITIREGDFHVYWRASASIYQV